MIDRLFPVCVLLLMFSAPAARAAGNRIPEQPQPAVTVPASDPEAAVYPAKAGEPAVAAEPDAAVAAEPNASASAAGATQPKDAFAARQAALDRRTTEINYRYAVQQHNCYARFFVNHCLNQARDAMRSARALVRGDQIALDDQQRAARARQRELDTEQKRARAAADAPQRAATDRANEQKFIDKQAQFQTDQARRAAQAPQRSANAQAYDAKQAEHRRKLEQARAQAAEDAQRRAANVQRFDEKQAEHQRKLDQARAQAAEDAKRRAENVQHFEEKQQAAEQHRLDLKNRQRGDKAANGPLDPAAGGKGQPASAPPGR